MRLTIAYSKIKMRNLVLINNDTYQRETLSERPIRQPLTDNICTHTQHACYITSTMEVKSFLVSLFYCPWLNQCDITR